MPYIRRLAVVFAGGLLLWGCPDDRRTLLASCIVDSDCVTGFCYGVCLEREGDSDSDGLSNREESTFGTDPLNPDTDGDGAIDGDEARLDSDGDTKNDAVESSIDNVDGDCLADQDDDDDLNAPEEICDNDVDDNCDGQVDEGCAPPPTLCEADTFVSANACAPCPAGATNAAGDDPAGEDTVCDDTCSVVVGTLCDDFQALYAKADIPSSNESYGRAVAVDGDTVAVGAPGDATAGGADAGAVFIYRHVDEAWIAQHPNQGLVAQSTGAGDRFGSALALSGDVLAVGAPQFAGHGAIHVFRRSGDLWNEEALLAPQLFNPGMALGTSLALVGDTLVTGAPVSDASVIGAGAVYTFTFDGIDWSEGTVLTAFNADPDDLFGASVALDSDGLTLVIGAPAESSSDSADPDDNSATEAGAVYIATRGSVTDSAWGVPVYVKATDISSLDAFGASVAAGGGVLAVGAPGEASSTSGINVGVDDALSDSGAVFVYELTNGSALFDVFVKASNAQLAARFGESVAFFQGRLAVGASGERTDGAGLGPAPNTAGSNVGAVYTYRKMGAEWSFEAFLKAFDSNDDDRFGAALALGRDILVVGAEGENSGFGGAPGANPSDQSEPDAGAAYVYLFGATP